MALTPGRGYDNSRLYDAEERIERTHRLKLQKDRPATPRHIRPGLHRGITVDSIAHGTFGTVKLVNYSGTDYVASLNDADEEITVEAGGYLLNSGETVDEDTAVMVYHFADNTWEVMNYNCATRDWTLEGE